MQKSLPELRSTAEYLGVVRSQAKSCRNQLRTLTQMLAEAEERLAHLGRLEALASPLEIAQPEEAQRNGTRRDTAEVE